MFKWFIQPLRLITSPLYKMEPWVYVKKNPIFHPLLLNNQNKKFISFKGSFVSFYLIHRSVITCNLSMNTIAWLKKKHPVSMTKMNQTILYKKKKHYTKRWVYNKKNEEKYWKNSNDHISDLILHYTLPSNQKKEEENPPYSTHMYIKGNSSILPKLTVWVFCIDYVLEENKNEQKSNGSLDGLFQKIILMGFVRSSSV